MLVDPDFSRVINALPCLVWAALPDGTTDFVNQRWCDYTGLALEEGCSEGWQSAVHPEDRSELVARWRRIVDSTEAGNLEARLRGGDGTYRWFLIACNPMRGQAGRVIRWYAIHSDIDGQKPKKEAFGSDEQDLRSIINTIPMTAWSTRADGYCDFCNQRWLDFAGLSLEQVQGWGWGAAIHPEDLDGLMEHWQACLASGAPVSAEARMRRFDGVYRWFLFMGNPLRDGSGAIVKWFGTNVDIEDRKRAEEELKANERDLIRIINTIPTTAWSTRSDGYCEFLSDRWLDYAGFTYEQAVGWRWAAAIHPDDAPALQEHWLGCLATGTPVNTEARIRRFDGVYRWFLFLAQPFRDESGSIVKWFGTNVDIEDRKRSDEALRENERNLMRIINTIPTTAWATRADGYCEFLSDRWLDYAGFTYEEAVGWNWAAAIHPDDVAGLQEHWLSSLASGTPVNTEARMRRFDGVYRWFLFLAQPFRDQSGTIIKWYGTNVDIEDRKQADEALRASERNLIQIINTIPTLAWSNDPDGHVDFLNQRWLEFTGLSADQGAGWGWSAAVHPEDVGGLLEYWRAALATGTGVDVEARLRRFDGEYRRFHFRASPLRGASGNIIKWYGTNTDIEDRKQVEEELRRSEAFLEEGQRLNLSGSFSWCLATDEITFSEQLYSIFGVEEDEPITLDLIASRVHPEDAQLLSEKIASARAGENDLNYEIRLRMPDGEVKYLRTVAHVTNDRKGRPEVIGAVQDVTERQLQEEALGKVRMELARMARIASLGALTASIAHEVSQPLSGIITNANTGLRMLAADPPNVDGVVETVRRTLRDGNRASAVISKLRALFGNKSITTESVNLNDATREVLALLLSELQRNRIVLRSELDDDLPPVVGDRIQLQQVILNLLLNASEALAHVDDRPRQIVVKTERDGDDSVRVTVQDAGVGIDPQHMDELFDAFYTTKDGGMGMGLSVSRSIIESHQGCLRVLPNEGPGAQFSFSLPRATEESKRGAIQEAASHNRQSVSRDL